MSLSSLKNLCSLTLDFGFIWNKSVMPLHFIARTPNLSTLSLARTHLEGRLSAALLHLNGLNRLALYYTKIHNAVDTWEKVFSACLGLLHLKELKLEGINYIGFDDDDICIGTSIYPPTGINLICTGRDSDMLVAKNLEVQMMKRFEEAQAMECNWTACGKCHTEVEMTDVESESSESDNED